MFITEVKVANLQSCEIKLLGGKAPKMVEICPGLPRSWLKCLFNIAYTSVAVPLVLQMGREVELLFLVAEF